MFAIRRFNMLVLSFFCMTISSQASAIMIDLNSFTANVPSAVARSADGLSALFSEDISYSPIALINPGLVLPGDAQLLRFDYELTVPGNNSDYFDFYLGELSAPLFSVGGHAASGSQLVFSDTYIADVSGYANSPLPMVFALSYDWSDLGLDSTLTIRNVEIVEQRIPNPATLFLFVSGLFGLMLVVKGKIGLKLQSF